MKRTILVWSAIAALCIAGTIYEFPSAISSLRCHRYVHSGWTQSATTLVPDKLVTQDPEAGAILRYVLDHRYADPNVSELRSLVAEHPQNEFFLSLLVERLMRLEDEDAEGSLALVDRLQAVDPNNAHTRYLRAWVLLEAPEAKGRLDAILTEFQQADQLPEFYLPYGKYKHRVARLAGQAALPGDRRPRLYPWPYRHFGWRLTHMADWQNMDRESFHQLMASAIHMTDRVVENAYGLESLRTGAKLMEELERTRLQRLDLTEAEARQARQRLAQATAMGDLRYREHLDTWHSGGMIPVIVAWFSMGATVVFVVLAILTKRKAWPAMQLKPDHGLRSIPGIFMLIALLLVLALHRWRFVGQWMSLLLMSAWYVVWLPWLGRPLSLLHVSAIDAARPERSPWRSRTAHAVLWLNWTLLLLMSNSEFFASGHLAGWLQNIGIFIMWSAFCLLVWLSTSRPRVNRQWPRRNFPLAAAMSWAVALIAFDVSGGQHAYESHIWADPLSVYPQIPAATKENYERYVRDRSPLDDLEKDGADALREHMRDLTPQDIQAALARHQPEGQALSEEQFQAILRRSIRETYGLPEHIRYFAPVDMEAFLARRRAEGKALSEEQLQTILWHSARDVRPVIRRALIEMDTARQAQQNQD